MILSVLFPPLPFVFEEGDTVRLVKLFVGVRRGKRRGRCGGGKSAKRVKQTREGLCPCLFESTRRSGRLTTPLRWPREYWHLELPSCGKKESSVTHMRVTGITRTPDSAHTQTRTTRDVRSLRLLAQLSCCIRRRAAAGQNTNAHAHFSNTAQMLSWRYAAARRPSTHAK